MPGTETILARPEPTFVRGLGLLDSTMIVAGSMIGSGIFIVSADIARQVGSAGWLLGVWLVTGALTVIAALSYGELAAMMPRAGGQYVYLRESYSPLFGFLYGWTLFLVIQTGTIAAVAVAFARFLGVLVPAVSPTAWIIPPINLTSSYAISISLQQLIPNLSIVVFTPFNPKLPKRDIPLALLFGTGIVITLFVLANVAYLATLPLADIQHAADDRVGTALLNVIFGSAGAGIMAFAILISTFGCNNGLILAGARVYYAMARDRLFFKPVGTLNANHVPGVSLILQGLWASFLVLPRTRLKNAAGSPLIDPASGMEQYGNLYGNLLDYVVFSVLIFYILTVVAVFVMRRKRPDADRPYRAFGYPIVPALYVVGAATIVVVLLLYRTQTTWPGLLIVLTGIPVYFLWSRGIGAVSGER